MGENSGESILSKVCQVREFLWPGGQVNRLVKKFSIYYVNCPYQLDLGKPEGGESYIKLLYECGKSQSRGPSFVGVVHPSRHHDILLYSTKDRST